MISSMPYFGCQPSTLRAFSEEATRRAGSPGLRPATCALIGSPVTLRALSIISFTEKPWPLPRLQTVLAPPAAR